MVSYRVSKFLWYYIWLVLTVADINLQDTEVWLAQDDGATPVLRASDRRIKGSASNKSEPMQSMQPALPSPSGDASRHFQQMYTFFQWMQSQKDEPEVTVLKKPQQKALQLNAAMPATVADSQENRSVSQTRLALEDQVQRHDLEGQPREPAPQAATGTEPKRMQSLLNTPSPSSIGPSPDEIGKEHEKPGDKEAKKPGSSTSCKRPASKTNVLKKPSSHGYKPIMKTEKFRGGWTMIVKKRESGQLDKSYIGPDGTSYRMLHEAQGAGFKFKKP